MKVQLKCDNCGKTFERQHWQVQSGRQYCGRKCHAAAQRARISVMCDNCGRSLSVTTGELKTWEHHFCDKKCKGEWMIGRQGVGKVRLTCANCGKAFERWPSLIKSGAQLCSPKCRQEHHGTNYQGEKAEKYRGTVLICGRCGRTFTRSRARHKGERNRHHFCGMECYAAWRSESGVASGANNAHWKGGGMVYYGPNWNAQKRAARKRDSYQCRHCGKTQKENGRALDVHHIRPFREFGYMPGENENYKAANDLANLITLCPTCHKHAEAGKIPIQPWLVS